ncbi:hypothetical protein [Pseudoxanthomonas mexicana]
MNVGSNLGAVAAVGPSSPIEVSVSAIASSQTTTSQLISLLADRLTSVLEPSHKDQPKANPGAPAPLRAPLHSDLVAACHRQDQLNEGLQEILDRLVVG